MASHPLIEPGPHEHEMQTELEMEAIEQLERYVVRPDFLQALESAAKDVMHFKPPAEAHPLARGALQESDADTSAGWEHATAEDAPAPPPPEFELVEREDAVEAMAYYIAQCLTKHPEAQVMSPKQLQDALSTALKVGPRAPFEPACSCDFCQPVLPSLNTR